MTETTAEHNCATEPCDFCDTPQGQCCRHCDADDPEEG